MTPELRKASAFFIATVGLGVAGTVLVPKLMGTAAGPEAEIIGELKRTEKGGISLAIPGARSALVSSRHTFDRITVQVDLAGRSGEAASTLDFVGALDDTEVSSLGVEKTRFTYARDWQPAAEGWTPRLRAAVSALEARRAALEKGDLAALAALVAGDAGTAVDPEVVRIIALGDRRYQVRAWYIRLDRDGALVREDYRLVGVLPDRPVDEEGTRSLELERRGGEFFFSKGLM